MCDPPQVTSVALCNAGLSKLSCLDQLPNLQWLSLSDNALSSLEVCLSDDDMTILSVWCFFSVVFVSLLQTGGAQCGQELA